VHLIGFVIRIYQDARSPERPKRHRYIIGFLPVSKVTISNDGIILQRPVWKQG